MPENENDKPEPIVSRYVKARQAYTNATIIPYIFMAYPFAGVLIGWWLDSKFKTAPWLLLVFFFAGLVEAFREMMRIAKNAEEAMEDDESKYIDEESR